MIRATFFFALLCLCLSSSLADRVSDLRSSTPVPSLERETVRTYLQSNQADTSRYFPTIPAKNTNPYLKAVADRVQGQLRSPDERFERDLSEPERVTSIKGTYGSRTLADEAFSFIDAAVYALTGAQREEAVWRAYRRLHLYFRDYRTLGAAGKPIDDFFFGVGTVFQSAVLLDQAFPGLVSPRERRLWELAMRASSEVQLKAIQDPTYGYYMNRDLGVASTLVNAGLFTGDTIALKAGTDLMLEQGRNIYPDGAYAYIGDQNECPGYHGSCIIFLQNLWRMTGRTEALDFIRRSKNYYPLTVAKNGLDPYWTASSWKTAWNGASTNGAAVVAHLTGSGENLFPPTPDQGLSAAFFYRPGLRKVPLQDGLKFDRNIQGPQGRFGNFNFSATGRVYGRSSRYPGKVTLVGGMVTNPSGLPPLNAALKSVYSHVSLAAEDKWNNGAYLITNEKNSIVTQSGVASLCSSHDLEGTSFGPSRRKSNWRGRQQILMFPDRIITLAEVLPDGGRRAWNLSGRLKLGYGRSGQLEEKTLRTTGSGRHEYGDLVIVEKGTNYSSLSINRQAPILRDEAKRATELIFSDGQQNRDTAYGAGTRKYFAAEVRPKSALGEAGVKLIREGDLFRGMQVEVNGETYLLVHNVSNNTATFRTTAHPKQSEASVQYGGSPVSPLGRTEKREASGELRLELRSGESALVTFKKINPPVIGSTFSLSFVGPSPANNAVLQEGASIRFTVTASANIRNMRLFKNGTLVRQENSAAYEWGAPGQNDPALRNLASGTYRFKVVATAGDGRVAEAERVITVDPVSQGGGGSGGSGSGQPSGGNGQTSAVSTGGFQDRDFYFWDFASQDAPLQAGAQRFTPETTAGFFRWINPPSSIGAAQHTGGQLTDNFRRSIIYGRDGAQLRHQLRNGTWNVQLEFADGFRQDNMIVRAEGLIRASNIDVPARTLRRVNFDVTITDGALDLELDDADGRKVWTLAGLLIRKVQDEMPTQARRSYRFDFGTVSSPVFGNWTRVTPETRSGTFRWLEGGLSARDRGRSRAEDDVRRDLIFSSQRKLFRIDVPNGRYRVKVMFGDYTAGHDQMTATAEGVSFGTVSTTVADPRREISRDVDVGDGNLTIEFRDLGGADVNWTIMGVIIDPI